MSLDVYLESTELVSNVSSGIFIRDNGSMREISRAEWDRLNPGREPVVARQERETNEVYHDNITHNLNSMAVAAGIYDPLWRPDEIGITKALDLIEPLGKGLAKLLADRKAFEVHNPSNGWGTYDGLVKFVSGYLKACIDNPTAEVRVWR